MQMCCPTFVTDMLFLSLPDKRGSSHVLLIYLYLAQHIYTSFARGGNYGGVFGRVHLSCELKKICQFIFKCDFSSGAKQINGNLDTTVFSFSLMMFLFLKTGLCFVDVWLQVTSTDCLNLRDNIKVFKSVEGLNSWIETFRNNLSESALDEL